MVGGGGLGVQIFFVISGFLITTLLLKEKITDGSISLKKFYIRRALRILPVAYLYIIALFVIDAFWDIDMTFFASLGAILFLRNFSFLGSGNWFVNHYWSLSVEEQFYWLFPFLLKKNIKIYFFTILTLIATSIFLRFYTSRFNEGNVLIENLSFFFNNVDGILIGSLISIITFNSTSSLLKLIQYRSIINLFIILFIIGFHQNFFNKHIYHLIPSFILPTIISTLIGIFIIINIPKNNSLLFKFLNSKPMVQIGLLSYSIYIWQQLFTISEKYVTNAILLPWYSFPLNIILLLAISYISYYFYEKRFNLLKAKFK